VNPQDLAADRFKPIRQAEEQISRTEAAHVKAVERLEQLRVKLAGARRRDEWALGQALVDGKAEPQPEAEQIRVEIERQELRVEALRLAIGKARREIPALVEANRAGWCRQAMRELSRMQQRYGAAIEELQASREALSDSATLIAWLKRGDLAEAASDSLAGRNNLTALGPPVLAFSRVLAALREDVEHLAGHPARGEEPEPRIDAARVKAGALLSSGWGD
jgi:hypothetical protein